MLSRESKGFESRHLAKPLTHLSFIDDLKVFETSKRDLQLTLDKVETLARWCLDYENALSSAYSQEESEEVET